MIQTGRPWSGRLAAKTLPGIKSDVMVVPTGGEKCGRVSKPLRDLQTQNAMIEIEGAIEVRDLKMDMPHSDLGMDGRLAHTELDDGRGKKHQSMANISGAILTGLEYACGHHGIVRA